MPPRGDKEALRRLLVEIFPRHHTYFTIYPEERVSYEEARDSVSDWREQAIAVH